MAKIVDDWQVLESSTNRGQEGVFISMSPGGRIAFSKELTKMLDPKLPRCLIKYSVAQQKMRLYLQREIAANTYAWRTAKGGTANFTAESALRSKGLVPEKITLYSAFVSAVEGQAPYIEVDVSKALVEYERKKAVKEPEPPAVTMMECARCGTKAEASRIGDTFVLGRHKDKEGDPCFCRFPKPSETVKK